MKQSTKRTLNLAAASTLILVAAAGAFAGGGFGPGGGGRHGMMGGPGGMGGGFGGPGAMMSGDPVAYTDQHLDQLKTNLGITADQEDAWNVYVEAAKEQAGLMASHRATMAGMGRVGPEQRQALHQQGWAQMQKVFDATRELYATLTPEQQAKAGGLIGPRCAAL